MKKLFVMVAVAIMMMGTTVFASNNDVELTVFTGKFGECCRKYAIWANEVSTQAFGCYWEYDDNGEETELRYFVVDEEGFDVDIAALAYTGFIKDIDKLDDELWEEFYPQYVSMMRLMYGHDYWQR